MFRQCWVSYPRSLNMCPGSQSVMLECTGLEKVIDSNAPQEQGVCNQGTMASPGEGFRTHEREPESL